MRPPSAKVTSPGRGDGESVHELEMGEVDVVLPHLLQATGDDPLGVDRLDPRRIVELRDGRERPRRRRPLGVVPGEDQPVDLEHGPAAHPRLGRDRRRAVGNVDTGPVGRRTSIRGTGTGCSRRR